MLTRRRFLESSLAAAFAAGAPWRHLIRQAHGLALIPGLSDPAAQPKFAFPAPNALDPSFKYSPGMTGEYTVGVGQATHYAGLVGANGNLLPTPIFGYGNAAGPGFTWPGRTFEVQSRVPTTVNWDNNLFGVGQHLLPVDTSLHWAYSHGGHSIAADGVPIVTHVHGGHSDFQFDGNPEFWYSPGGALTGPSWSLVPGGFTNKFVYDNTQPAGTNWYHDHTLGITRLNVYAGMAGFFIVRDELDTGLPDNPLGLPAFPYELAYAIQDRMFEDSGALFYPAFPGDPFYADFIDGEGAVLPESVFPGGGPTALAEFFGDHMLVNGIIWPKAEVEPRHYRLRLLNGCDSRFLGVRFRAAASPSATGLEGASGPLPFRVIGSDQGLAFRASEVETLLIGPGERYDVVFDFSRVPAGARVIMENIGGDAPFGGELVGRKFPGEDLFEDRQTDRIMAFDVVLPLDPGVPDNFDHKAIRVFEKSRGPVDKVRRLALFEGTDEFGRLQPLLGTAEPVQDATGAWVNGAIAWASPTTENPDLGAEEIWEIYNATGDAHPVHLHLVHFEVLGRRRFKADVVEQPVLQHNGEFGNGFRLENVKAIGKDRTPEDYERAPKDTVTALPGEVTRIRMTFDKPGRYAWHCHILSHEDHEMMRVLHVGPGA